MISVIMEIEIDFTESAQQNADDFYKKSKKLLQKKAGAAQAIKDLENRLKKLKAEGKPEERATRIKIRTQKEWYEKFHWSATSGGLLTIGGRDAQQNEILNSKHFDSQDLFFHADIFGASVTILKGGVGAPAPEREEAAQFAACYSSAWKEMLHSVDVYAMRRDQVSKSTGKGAVGTGSFLLSGEREWYRNTRLALVFFMREERLNVVSQLTFDRMAEKPAAYVLATQGSSKKSDAAKVISKALSYNDLDAIMQQLPAGTFHLHAVR